MWQNKSRPNKTAKIPYAYKADDDDPLVLIPDPIIVRYVEQAMDYLDEGHSSRRTADWLSEKSGKTISHQGLSNIWKAHRSETSELLKSRKEAEQQLYKLHPDFGEIRQDPTFHEWVAMQPGYIQDALYKNNTDAHAAARALDLYKADTGRRKTSNKKSAATSVGRTSSSTPGVQGKAKFSESQVSKMSDREYEQNEDAIMEAMRSGAFVYDISGAAR